MGAAPIAPANPISAPDMLRDLAASYPVSAVDGIIRIKRRV